MKIIMKLAYSQLKINRSRTIWTLIAIALSTALTTAVCSLVASGNAMLVGLLGEDYGVYASSYIALLLIPAVFLGILILAMSVTVISNVFRISAQERASQFGILKCTGATTKQIRNSVICESMLLCVVGIPTGIIIGLLLYFGGIGIANHFMGELNDLAHIMIHEVNLVLHFVISWQAILIAIMVSFFTVVISAWLPARKAAKVCAIDCIRGIGEVKIDRKQVRTGSMIDKYLGFEGTMASRNMKRNRQNFRATVISLSVGITLFIALSGLSDQAAGIEKMLYPNKSESVVADYVSARTTQMNKKTGRDETTVLYPINSGQSEKVTEKLETYENIEVFGIGNDYDKYLAVLPAEMITDQMQAVFADDEIRSDEIPVEIITIDKQHYEELCKKAGCPVGSTILLNHYSYNDFGTEVDLEPYSSDIKEIELAEANGNMTDMPIGGVLTKEDIPEELFYVNTNPIRLVVPEAEVRGYSWQCTPKDISGFIQHANGVMDEEFMAETEDPVLKEAVSVRVYKMDDYMKVMNIAIALVIVFMYSFVVLLMLIGLTNVISALSTNVLMRAREFAVLKSIGMTSEGLKKMLKYESVMCSMKALMYGLPIGIVMTFLINLPIRMIFPIPYKFPLAAIVLCVLAVLLITWGIMKYAAHKLKDQNIIETIRAESGR